MRELPFSLRPEQRKNVAAGLQTQHRTPIKPQPKHDTLAKRGGDLWSTHDGELFKPPHQVGDRLYLQEPYQILRTWYGKQAVEGVYLNDDPTQVDEPFDIDGKAIPFTDKEWKKLLNRKWPHRKTSGRFMYKSLARHWFEVTGVWAERVQDMSVEDAVAEGIMLTDTESRSANSASKYVPKFHSLWDSIYGKGAWERNDWGWKTVFRKV